MKAIAQLGPQGYAQSVSVDVIGAADLPGFVRCEDEEGKRLVVHRSKLQLEGRLSPDERASLHE